MESEFPHIYVERRQAKDRLLHSFVTPRTVLGTQEKGRLFTTPTAHGFMNEPRTDYVGIRGVKDTDNAHDRFRAYTHYANAAEEFGEHHAATRTHKKRVLSVNH